MSDEDQGAEERADQQERHRRAMEKAKQEREERFGDRPLAVAPSPPLPGQRVTPPDPARTTPRRWFGGSDGPGERADGRRVPSFLVIGAQKAGTTWLHEMLGEHPDVFLPSPKELHFLDHRRNYDLGIDWYADHFVDAPKGAVLGEATPNYLWSSPHLQGRWTDERFAVGWKHSQPERAAATLGRDLRLVVFLRDPVARAVSAFNHHLQVPGRLDPELSFRENATRWGIVHMGFYAAHLERWLTVFPREQVHVRLFEEVLQDPAPAMDAVFRHVGVEPVAIPEQRLRERVHGGTKHRDASGTYWFDEDHTQVAMTPDDIDGLREVYAPENERLAELLGNDLSAWG